MQRILPLGLLIIMGLCSTGCANTTSAMVTPGVKVNDINSFFVLESDEDKRGVKDEIVKQLADRGYDVSAGTSDMVPEHVEAVVDFDARWIWDVTMYLIELSITFSDPKTDYTLASGYSYHASLARKSKKQMVDEVLTNMFRGGTE